MCDHSKSFHPVQPVFANCERDRLCGSISAYQYYAYKRKAPDWLKTKMIFSQVSQPDVHKSYRNKVQQYSEEEGSFLENLKHGFIFGSQDFIDDIKARFLKDQGDVELPNKNSLFKDHDIGSLLESGSKLIKLDMKSVRAGKRIGAGDKDKRDLLIYLLLHSAFKYAIK